MERSSFGKLRSYLWPIHRHELRKFLPIFAIFFLIAFNYNILRSYKDSIVVTASHSGVETIPFIKLWLVLPSAMLITLAFTRLCNRFSREKVFYITLSFFLGFFLLFALVLYPFQDALHPHLLADRLEAILPKGFLGLIAIFRNWTYSLFYVMAELWSTAIFTVLFWGFANEVITVSEAKRFYGLLTVGGSLAGVFSGGATVVFSKYICFSWLLSNASSWDQSIFCLCFTVVLMGLITMVIFRWVNKYVILPEERQKGVPREKFRMSMRKNFAYLAQSKYLRKIALIVLSYNIAINLVEVVWKDQMRALFQDPSDYNAYMGEVIFFMGAFATLTGIFTTTKIVQRFSWTVAALVPPMVVGVSGLIFFNIVLFPKEKLSWLFALFQMSPLMLTVHLGSLQNCVSRSSKYTFFDATKEMAFIPLSSESRLKGKAAIDGVGSRLGKSGGSAIHQALILAFSSVAASSLYIGILFFFVILLWTGSVISLGKDFEEATSEEDLLEKKVLN